ncbi:MAG: aa3-type cytochrome c oxidase subunit IV [Alphaproteobacteria bacterium]
MATEHDVEAHQKTWTAFTRLLAVCMVGVTLVLVLLAAFVV